MKNKIFWIASLGVISMASAQSETPEYYDEAAAEAAPLPEEAPADAEAAPAPEAAPKRQVPVVTTITQPTNEVAIKTGGITVFNLSPNYRPADAVIRSVELTDDFYEKTGQIANYAAFVIVKREADGSFDYDAKGTTFISEVELKPDAKTRQLGFRFEHHSFGPFGRSLITPWDEGIDVRKMTPEEAHREVQKVWLQRVTGTYVWGFGKRIKAYRAKDGSLKLGETITNSDDFKEENIKKGGYEIVTRLAGNGLGTIKVTLSAEDEAVQTELLKTP